MNTAIAIIAPRTQGLTLTAGSGLPRLTDTTWNLRCANLAEKQELLALAASRGITCGQVDANDLGLGWNERQDKLYSFPAEWAGKAEAGRPCRLIGVVEFRLMLSAARQKGITINC